MDCVRGLHADAVMRPSAVVEADEAADLLQSLDAQSETALEEQIINREQQEKLLRQIEQLEKRCRAEKQTRKRYELHQQIVKLKEELK